MSQPATDDATAAPAPPKHVPQTYDFDIDYTSPSGAVYRGSFTTKILTVGEELEKGKLRAQALGETPIANMHPITFEIAHMIAHLSLSLTRRPPWAKDLKSLFDIDLVQDVYKEVAAHEARFFGPRTNKAAQPVDGPS